MSVETAAYISGRIVELEESRMRILREALTSTLPLGIRDLTEPFNEELTPVPTYSHVAKAVVYLSAYVRIAARLYGTGKTDFVVEGENAGLATKKGEWGGIFTPGDSVPWDEVAVLMTADGTQNDMGGQIMTHYLPALKLRAAAALEPFVGITEAHASPRVDTWEGLSPYVGNMPSWFWAWPLVMVGGQSIAFSLNWHKGKPLPRLIRANKIAAQDTWARTDLVVPVRNATEVLEMIDFALRKYEVFTGKRWSAGIAGFGTKERQQDE